MRLARNATVGQIVRPERMSLPERAGIIDPADFLKGSHLEQFTQMHKHVPIEVVPSTRVKACHKVRTCDVVPVYNKLLQSGVAALLLEEQALYDSTGRLVSGGLFGGAHKEHSDRVINDRRHFNQAERRLVWARLPHGTLLTQIVLNKEFSVRASGDDLKNAVLFRYLRAQHVVDVQQFMRSARRADALLQAFAQHTCDTPTSRAVRLAKHAVFFCQILWPRLRNCLRHRLPETWALLRALEELQPKHVRVPLPFPLLLCMVVAARINGCRVRGRSAQEWFVFACSLPCLELMALRARDVGTLNGFPHCTLRIAKPKNR